MRSHQAGHEMCHKSSKKAFFRFRIKDNSHLCFIRYEEVTLEMLLLQCCMHGDVQCVYWQPQLFQSLSVCHTHQRTGAFHYLHLG